MDRAEQQMDRAEQQTYLMDRAEQQMAGILFPRPRRVSQVKEVASTYRWKSSVIKSATMMLLLLRTENNNNWLRLSVIVNVVNHLSQSFLSPPKIGYLTK